MLVLNLIIVGDRISEGDASSINGILCGILPHIKLHCRYKHGFLIYKYQAITCDILISNESKEFWQYFFDKVREIRKYFLEELEKQVRQIIISPTEQDESQRKPYHPSSQLLGQYQGIWICNNIGEYIINFLTEANTPQLEDWFFFPFDTDETDVDYEHCTPSELQEIGNQINGSVRRMSVPIGVRIRLAKGYRLSDYISATFYQTLQSFSANQDSEYALTLGGKNVILTTLLQMNDKLDLVNHYSEKITETEDMTLYSLSAMNLSLVDERDETDIAVLVSSGQLIIEDIKLGHEIGG